MQGGVYAHKDFTGRMRDPIETVPGSSEEGGGRMHRQSGRTWQWAVERDQKQCQWSWSRKGNPKYEMDPVTCLSSDRAGDVLNECRGT